jgi:hypothetical protein
MLPGSAHASTSPPPPHRPHLCRRRRRRRCATRHCHATSQVPAEIVKDLAPGLSFNSEGLPVMPGMGEGMMPHLPGMPNPLMEGVDPQNCCLQ